MLWVGIVLPQYRLVFVRARQFCGQDHGAISVIRSLAWQHYNLISGRQAIKEFWSNLIHSANAKSAILSSVDVTPTGDGVVEIGRATLTVQPEGSDEAQMEVKYVVFWREEDSRWKWHLDIWNQNS
jgi:ketosteroid isomerase-like protein